MSAEDLAKWDIARMNRTLLSPKDWAEQETPVNLSDSVLRIGEPGIDRDDDSGLVFRVDNIFGQEADRDIARMNRTLLSPKDWAEQETPVNLTSGASTGYGPA
jgi:hypothetical protein